MGAEKGAQLPPQLQQVRPVVVADESMHISLPFLLHLENPITNHSFFVLYLEGFDPVGTVTSLRVLESRGNVIRISWVGVPGATAYRVVWSQHSGKEAAEVY